MKAPLYDKLIKYSREITSFHMPGHKFGNLFNMREMQLLDLDVTEVEGLDNLYEAEEVILQAENKMAKRYTAKESIFLTNGSTAGIIASVLSICKPGDYLIVARNCHHSVWNALILGGINPIYISPTYNENYNIVGGICPIELERLLKENPHAKGLIMVSPTYEGFVSDIEKISSIVDKYNKILIVDEAHGAHFIWNQAFPESAVETGADLIIQSMHKTLPAIGQSAILHIASPKLEKDNIINKLEMVQTSSPSYIMMGLMDYIRYKLEENPKIWHDYIKGLVKARKKLAKLENLQLLKEDICGSSNIYNIDISKIVILTNKTNITGVELGRILRNKYNIQVELEADNYIIAMSMLADKKGDLQLFTNALFEIDASLQVREPKKQNYIPLDRENKSSARPRDIYYGKQDEVYIDDSIGRISACNLMLFPPGIPLICIGEIFSKEIVEYIKISSDKILGIIKDNNKVKVLVSEKGNNNEG